ncbi:MULTISPECIES: adenylate/guanylate cyclase domain-containing protein [unclassified Bradyrhizobium]|uniref:adenylate/guanylate cyclase domain-containing protein n=1 Tax=unclassified Bradyrhizobium TaxID=2631580 RepID=UPI00247A4E47|nr:MULTISPECIES: adenylate/guanylate cyclase domain-containing protein [unclassified Bradyrhizobium]WGR71999.1 adenylate/guanylate cyclase domain-containing protein [Bradyrhizobium sp. ISRA426]WGR76833.1 adenylate/guanylate cyclase domain-containing protein [Bradyrhizobium sp. ISRA430]WGR87238.1 adenylate/guanylate cyclase domain-containing protein [Bradyrhizobium sp. ISRA432]
MAADVAGYSRLMHNDEEATHAKLTALLAGGVEPAIAQHGGRIVKNTGDGFLAEFPSAVEAVRAAMQFQSRINELTSDDAEDRRILFRVGLNIGDIIVEAHDIFGDGVNIAARLESIAEPGGICISQTVFNHARDKVPFDVEEAGEQTLKNIARPVHVYRIIIDPAPRTATPKREIPALALPDKPSVAVLPLTNMSGDPEQEFVSDGIAEDVITALSRYPSLFVIARNSSFTYKGRAVDVRQVGRELGVRYVLEGSVRKAGGRIRVTAQLIEAATSNHVWAERYDRDLADVFAVQDELTEALTTALAPAIADAELRRAMRRPPGSLDAWAAYQRGLWHLSKATADDDEIAEQFFRQAIDLDPTFGGSYSALALYQLQAAALYQKIGLRDAQRSAEALARRAVALDGADAEARSCLGWALQARGEADDALAEIERALSMSPNLAIAHGHRGATLIFAERPEEGVTALKACIRLDPRDPYLAVRLLHIACGLYFCGEYAASIEAAKRLIRSYPDFPMIYRWFAAALGQLGRTAEAREELEKAVSRAPGAFDMYVRNRAPWFRPEDHAHLIDGLRKAGWRG